MEPEVLQTTEASTLPGSPTFAGSHGLLPVDYSVWWNTGANQMARAITPIMKPKPGGGYLTATEYYSYNNPYGASANTPDQLEQSNTAIFFLYDDGQELSLFVILDKPNDGSGLAMDMQVAGVPMPGSYISVKDDPGDASYALNGDGTMNVNFRSWPCCTDGFVISGLADTWAAIEFAFSQIQGIDQLKWLSQENGAITAFSIPRSLWNTVSVRAAYQNEAPNAVAAAPASVELDGSPTTNVTLDGSASDDGGDGPDPLTYSWSLDGIVVANGATPTVNLGIGTYTFTLTVSDGLAEATDDVTVEVVDPSAPTVEVVLSGTEGANGWWISDVGITWVVTDLESAVITTGCEATTAGEGTTTSACSATSAGGTTDDDVTVNVDTTVPDVGFSGNVGDYDLLDDVAITCSATDSGSGIDTGATDCPEASGPAYTFGIGSHTLTASAADLAGNTAEATTTFQVVGDAESVCSLIGSWISNRGVANSLCAKLRAAERANERGNAKAAAGATGAFENEVRALTGRWLTDEQAAFLLDLF